MNKKKLSYFKIAAFILFIAGLLSFGRSLEPQRNEVQKVYDDFLRELDRSVQLTLAQLTPNGHEPPVLINSEISVNFTIKDSTGIREMKSMLNWGDPVALKKAFRVLDLLRMANVFSISNKSASENAQLTIRVIGVSGYKFESFLFPENIEKNSPLNLAIVLMRELSTNSQQH